MSLSLHDEITRRYYQTTAERSYVASREYYERAADGLMSRLRPWLPQDRGADCLDLACGCGEMLFLLERQGFRHTAGVALCEEELAQARPYVRGQLTHADVVEYLRQSKSASVDFVTALNFLEHLSKDTLL